MLSTVEAMTTNNYLSRISANAVLSGSELQSIGTSIRTIANRLTSYFGPAITTQFRFGSSMRGTILPRSLDARSDIDYMVVFADARHQPQTYLNQLRRFVERYYPSSVIKQSAPTMVLELNHIKFDLAPALRGSWGPLGPPFVIPDGQGGWRGTNPNDFNDELAEADVNQRGLLKPTIRLAKMWNARAGHVFDSYLFEKWITNRNFWFCSNLRDHLFDVFDGLGPVENAKWKNDAITRAKRIVA
jgi:Second Messenger Oligonucleotide or Dinucleotide Synthetase domain